MLVHLEPSSSTGRPLEGCGCCRIMRSPTRKESESIPYSSVWEIAKVLGSLNQESSFHFYFFSYSKLQIHSLAAVAAPGACAGLQRSLRAAVVSGIGKCTSAPNKLLFSPSTLHYRLRQSSLVYHNSGDLLSYMNKKKIRLILSFLTKRPPLAAYLHIVRAFFPVKVKV